MGVISNTEKNIELAEKIKIILNGSPPKTDLCMVNHVYAAAMARVKYMSCSGSIPLSLKAQAHYWKVYYNASPHGRTEVDYLKTWKELCSGVYPGFQ